MIHKIFKFIKKVALSAFNAVTSFVKDTINNAAGVALLAGSAIGFTKLAIEVPFYIQLPLWIEATMVAPALGILSVFLLVHLMRFQMKLQGIQYN